MYSFNCFTLLLLYKHYICIYRFNFTRLHFIILLILIWVILWLFIACFLKLVLCDHFSHSLYWSLHWIWSLFLTILSILINLIVSLWLIEIKIISGGRIFVFWSQVLFLFLHNILISCNIIFRMFILKFYLFFFFLKSCFCHKLLFRYFFVIFFRFLIIR